MALLPGSAPVCRPQCVLPARPSVGPLGQMAAEVGQRCCNPAHSACTKLRVQLYCQKLHSAQPSQDVPRLAADNASGQQPRTAVGSHGSFSITVLLGHAFLHQRNFESKPVEEEDEDIKIEISGGPAATHIKTYSGSLTAACHLTLQAGSARATARPGRASPTEGGGYRAPFEVAASLKHAVDRGRGGGRGGLGGGRVVSVAAKSACHAHRLLETLAQASQEQRSTSR
mmetsp:Transcript_65117/g.174117  ORF Transcript_65117/g.174117 Transcript_65117/m.174117 type:complete len:228 (-) Transcript_65117:410-1093(-)